MIRGIIGPKGRPGWLHAHRSGAINLIGPRRFEVDVSAPEVIDEWKDGLPLEPLILPPDVYQLILDGIREGDSMYVEPLDGEPDLVVAELREQLAQRDARIAELEKQLAGARRKKPDGAE